MIQTKMVQLRETRFYLVLFQSIANNGHINVHKYVCMRYMNSEISINGIPICLG